MTFCKVINLEPFPSPDSLIMADEPDAIFPSPPENVKHHSFT